MANRHGILKTGWLRHILVPALALGLILSVTSRSVLERAIPGSNETASLVAAPNVAGYLARTVGPHDRVLFGYWAAPQVDYYVLASSGHRVSEWQDASRDGDLDLVLNDGMGVTLEIAKRQQHAVAWKEFYPPVRIHQFPKASIYYFKRQLARPSS